MFSLRNFLTIISILTTCFTLNAQTGSIKGTILDAKSNEHLMGAVVTLSGTNKGAQADLDGKFLIENIENGTYNLNISFVSYLTKSISVSVKDGQVTEIPPILMEGEVLMVKEVEIRANKRTNTEVSVLVETKKLEQITVGISAQQITKTQDRDASQVIRRVPGVSIMDERFVMIRGLNERYNTVLLNDAITPSTEVDVRAFSFDLIPANAIDRMLIFKTAASENPGEMAGGVVKIYTKSRPDFNSTNFSFSTGYRTGVTGAKAQMYVGGKLDALGFDDGARALPTNFGSRSVLNSSNRDVANAQFRNLPVFFAPLKSQSLLPDFRASLGLSRLFKIAGKEASNITNINYSIVNNLPQKAIQERYEGINNNELAYNWQDIAYSQQVRVGAMSNFSLIANDKTRIDFRNLFNQAAISETLLRNGSNDNEKIDFRNYAFRYEARTIYSGQLNATHEISEKAKLNWNAGYGFTNRYEPDYRRLTTSGNKASDQSFKIDVPPVANPSLTQAARFWSALNEHIMLGAVNYERKIVKSEKELKFRTGLFTEYKSRDFNARWFGYINPKNADIVKQTPVQFFDPQNISNNSGGVSMLEGTNFDDQYQAQNLLTAVYASVYVPFTAKFNATIGFRGEFNNQQLQSKLRGSGTAVNVENPIFSPLPSVNMTYDLTEKQKLRFSYGMTVNRPEFRELAPFSYYDFNFNISKTGNPDLKTATIQNIDARYEIYPNEGEMITLAAFYKHFANPIEVSGRAAGSGTAFFFSNPNRAKSAGAELEIRKILGGGLTLVANASLIYSRVDASNLQGQLSNRPLQGQSPYLVNAGLYYNNETFQANILYNVIGKRIFVTGDNLGNQTIYEMPRNVIDVNISKTFGKMLELKLGVSDLLNQAFRYTSDSNSDAKIDDTDKNWRTFQRGTAANLSLNFKF